MGDMGVEQTFHEEQDDGYDDSNPYLPRTPEAYRAAWADLERLWAQTTAKARTLSEDQLLQIHDASMAILEEVGTKMDRPLPIVTLLRGSRA